ncbi:MAG: 4-hydroxythreonine-4-phosphate dehydrogenase PdxA [Hyphomicrobiaceae bacterium]
MGDPAGIGPDITLKAWAERKIQSLPPFYVIADADLLTQRAGIVDCASKLAVLDETMAADPLGWSEYVAGQFPAALPVLHRPVDATIVAGTPNVQSAENVIASIDQAIGHIRTGHASAMVTNPIAKDVVYRAGFKHPGHTEYLAERANQHWGGHHRPVMMIAADEMRVVPVTIHIPLKDVPTALTKELIVDTVGVTARALKEDFGIKTPKVACTGLNPHAGENRSIGTEDNTIIAPAIATLRDAGHDVEGPFPADTIFHAETRAPYDAIVAMYHDQALIPIKTLAFDRAVNVTLGLPFIRTSPDHGTAFGIAGTGNANPGSLIEAIKLAARMAAARAGQDA